MIAFFILIWIICVRVQKLQLLGHSIWQRNQIYKGWGFYLVGY